MTRSEFLALGGSAALLGLLTGCGAAAAPAATRRKVALVAKSTSTEFWQSVFAGAQAAAAEYNLELSITGPETEEDYETQNAMVARAVADGAEALVFSAIDFENNAAAIDAAAAAGVRIVSIDSAVDSAAVKTYIGTDNYAAGRMAAEAVRGCGFASMNLGLVNYDVNSANGQQREQGVRDMIAGNLDMCILDSINVLAEAENAQAATAAMLKTFPTINVLIAFNEPVSVGAARAVRELGLAGRVWLVGFDSNVETVDMLQSGEVDALIVQNTYAIGYLGIESAHRLLTGEGGALSPTVDTSTVTVNLDNLFTIDSQKALFAFEG